MEEIWKSIDGTNGDYEVSSRGRIRSIDRYVVRRGSKNKQFLKGQIIKISSDSCGYAMVCINIDGKRRSKNVHRLVACAFLPNVENKREVNHKDSNRMNADVSNLEWCTSKENARHAYDTGRRKPLFGVDNHRSKLTNEQAVDIIFDRRTLKETAKDYGVTYGTIHHVRHGKVYREAYNHILSCASFSKS